MKKLVLFATAFAAFATPNFAQKITGNLQTNANFFIRDSIIGASNTPQYDYQKYGAESWLNLNYSNWGFDMGLRFDVFHNSNLPNPSDSYTAQGIGRWFIQKKIDKFSLAGGYLYDQIGSGIIWRAYEERALFIDQALYGIRLNYQINKNWAAKAFTGRQKMQFDSYNTVIHGGAIEGFIRPDSTRQFSIAPGFGTVVRTYNKATVDRILLDIAALPARDQFQCPGYNTYSASFYNTLSAGNFAWYVEAAGKSNDVIYDPFAETISGAQGKLKKAMGYTAYTSLSYAANGLGIVLEGKRTKDFSFRNTPYERQIQGPMNFLPVMAKQNTYRLTARFSPATQELGEQAIQLDARYAINKKLTVGLNFSDIQLLDGTELYREIYPEITYKNKKKWQLIAGVQLLKYNQQVYQGKGGMVDAVTPAAEFLYKFTKKKSLRIEAQYLSTEQEFGSWANLVAEVGLAPRWIIFASDMYKVPHKDKEKYPADKTKYDGIHYPSVGVAYTKKANRFALAYVKQVEGINCAGGICRYEPTFHGVRFNVNSNF